jgi:hypothetical protein
MNEPQDLALSNLLQLMRLKFVGILQAQRANVAMLVCFQTRSSFLA